LIGGEAFVFKLRPVNTTSNEDMLVQAHIDETKERRWRYEKHACGENPKVTTSLFVIVRYPIHLTYGLLFGKSLFIAILWRTRETSFHS
jgi:hypothetical protein